MSSAASGAAAELHYPGYVCSVGGEGEGAGGTMWIDTRVSKIRAEELKLKESNGQHGCGNRMEWEQVHACQKSQNGEQQKAVEGREGRRGNGSSSCNCWSKAIAQKGRFDEEGGGRGGEGGGGGGGVGT
ncbi:hypothetical protein CBR_g54106 [Chara braunii]|uniref:Uncharacterized protein n=1 Tax=Chara braunii TaxID=69332 RepID=A0A388MBQ7_CHABU|nr:hypothetical protein CBR_g54106 [Chara braunii]|eukprot:GBG92011.1 hypothetical protein CBR_g54106 [Chara braunii]